MYITTIKEKEITNLSESKIGVLGKGWRERKKGGNDVIML